MVHTPNQLAWYLNETVSHVAIQAGNRIENAKGSNVTNRLQRTESELLPVGIGYGDLLQKKIIAD